MSFAALAAPPAVEQQAMHLRTILQQADEAYFNQHESIMADAAYDALRTQYAQLVSDHPDLAKYSFTGTESGSDEKAVPHNAPVLSLEKAYDAEAVTTFIEKCGTHLNYRIEPKLDGLTVILRYRNGMLAQAITRGNGKTGTDVTAALLASGAVPHKLNHTFRMFDVRGEVIMPLSSFDALNERRITEGKIPLKSPRNTAAGTLRLNDFAEISNRGIQFRTFELLNADQMPATHTESMKLVRDFGLPVIDGKTGSTFEVNQAINEMNQKRASSPFATDGLVIKVDNRAVYEKLGSTSHHPRGAIARKYKEDPIAAELLRIEWSIGTTGRRTPVAHFTPIRFEGATVQSATLHNQNHLRALDLKIGDTIEVIRAGGAVPEIIGVRKDLRTGNETAIPTPK